MSENPWTPGYNENLHATFLPEMPYDVTLYSNLKYALDKLYVDLQVTGALITDYFNIMSNDIWINLPSGLKVRIAYKSESVFLCPDFRLPALTRTVVKFNILSLRYAAHLYPGQNKYVNLFYNGTTPIVKAYGSFGDNYAWDSNITRDYTLSDLAIDVSGVLLYAAILAIVIKKGFAALQNTLDAILHTKLNTLIETTTSNDSSVDSQLSGIQTSVDGLFRGSYV